MCFPNDQGNWSVYNWVPPMAKKLFVGGYRLGIVSNTHRYQDGQWVRNAMATNNMLQYFECTIFSATYAMHKPSSKIFKKIVDFMQIDPVKTVMVGDSRSCDGASTKLGMTYLPIDPKQDWSKKLFDLLDDDFPANRKLTNLFEYEMVDDVVVTKVRHLSEPLAPNDIIIINQQEYQVASVSKSVTKEEILNSHDEIIAIKVKSSSDIPLI